MFKKQKKKSKQETQTVDNKLQNQRSSNIGTDLSFDVIENRSNGEITDADQPDGFDSQGFVDLTPAENRPVLLGPKQLCQVFNWIVNIFCQTTFAFIFHPF